MSLEEALVENLHREDLNPLDEAGAYQQLIEDFNLTHEEVARKVGRSRAGVTNALRLFQLPPTVQRYVRDGQLSAGHARTLLGTPDRILQEKLANEAVDRGRLFVRWKKRFEVRYERRRLKKSSRRSPRRGREPDKRTRWRSRCSAWDPRAKACALASASRGAPPRGLLEDRLNTWVKVDMGGKRGRLVIEFAMLDDLERIYRVIAGETFT